MYRNIEKVTTSKKETNLDIYQDDTLVKSNDYSGKGKKLEKLSDDLR